MKSRCKITITYLLTGLIDLSFIIFISAFNLAKKTRVDQFTEIWPSSVSKTYSMVSLIIFLISIIYINFYGFFVQKRFPKVNHYLRGVYKGAVVIAIAYFYIIFFN